MRRILSLAALAALLTATSAAAKVPAARSASASRGAAFDLKDLSIAGYVGGEFGDLDGFYLRGDAALPLMPLAPRIQLLGVASLGFTHLGTSDSFFSVSWNIVKVTASGRAQMEVTPELDAYADLGLGFYFGGWKSETDIPILGTVKADDTTGGLTMRVAAGGLYRIDPKLSLGAELGFNPYFGDADTTNFFIGVGAQMKL